MEVTLGGISSGLLNKDETAGLRSQSGPWMAAPPVEGGPCVRGPACLMGIRHAANGRAARGAHGSGVQRPGWRSLGRSMDQCHLNWVCTECAQRSRQGPDPSVWSGEGPRSRWSDRVFRCAEGLPLQRAAQDRDTCSGHGRTGATGPPCAGLQNATTHMPTPDVGGRWPTAIVPRHRRCREAFATTRRPRRRR